MAGHPQQDQGAPVRLPPPLVYAVPLVLLALLDRALPWRLPDIPGRPLLGWLLVISGVALSASGAATFRRHGTTVIPHHAVSRLVTSGPYRLTRNPMYVGLTVAYLGVSLLVGSWWPLVALPVLVVVVDRFVVAREESYLRARFGAEYEGFCRRTRRWL